MTNNRKLGIYWGNTGICLVELDKHTLVTSAFVSFSDIGSAVPGVRDLNDDLKLLDLLQKPLRSGTFSVGNAFLSLPSKDIIVRWFMIPWVKADEIQGMVTFEAKKYLPFPLEELFFNYYPLTISKDGVRQIGIALTAIRKERYEHYFNILIQAGVNVVYSEPSAMSLLRTLVFRKLVNTEQLCAIVIAREDSGEIAIVSKGYVRFIRDFSLRSSDSTTEGKDADFLSMKLFNEVRMSLDFFSRNNAGPDVEKIIVIPSGVKSRIFDGMSDDVGIPVQLLEPNTILEKTDVLADVGHIRSFGVALSGGVPSVIDFNLSEDHAQKGDKQAVLKKSIQIPPQFFLIAGVVFGCIALFVTSSWWINSQIQKKQALKQEVSTRLGRYLNTPKEEIDAKLMLSKKKIEAITSLPLKSSLTPFFVQLTGLIPDGVWIDSIDISHDSAAQGLGTPVSGSVPSTKTLTLSDYFVVKTVLKLTVSGFASLDDTNAEFELVNQFVDKLASDAQIRQVFTDIKLKTLQARDFNPKQKVSAFTIEFK